MSLLADVEKQVTGILKDSEPKGFSYHNLKHTLEVVGAAALTGKNSGLTPGDLEIVQIAAWFHDAGYTFRYYDHETESIKIARDFLTSRDAGEHLIQAVINCIKATKIPQSPKNQLEEAVCDADMFHFSQEDFLEISSRLRAEQNNHLTKKRGKYKFMLETLELLKLPYFTAFAQRQWGQGKERNIKITEQILDKMLKEKEAFRSGGGASLKQESHGGDGKVRPKDSPERGIDTMFRVTARKQTNLNSMADNKSHILITLNAVVISIVTTLAISKYREFPYLLVPSLLLLISSFITMSVAIIAIRPRIYQENNKAEDLRDKKVNLLFFGNFFRMSLEDYLTRMKESMKSRDRVYEMMIVEQYFTGRVLARKYRLLRYAYTVFIIGYILALIAFTYVMIKYGGGLKGS
jgi:HD superfamily phosphodiesterase